MPARNRAFTLVELMVVIAILGLLASVLATSVVSKMKQASRELDKKALQDVYNALQMAVTMDDRAKKLISRGELAELRGREFLEGCFRHRLLSHDLLSRMVARSGQDVQPDTRWLDGENGRLHEMECSWAAPQGNECSAVMYATGNARRVVLSANSRNWFNFENEVIVIWSDNDTASYLTIEEASERGYAIDREMWQRPAELLGRVKPFDGVWD